MAMSEAFKQLKDSRLAPQPKRTYFIVDNF